MSRLIEMDTVALKNAVHGMPTGAQGTVVSVWRKGEAYEVEFTEPEERLLTVSDSDLILLEPDVPPMTEHDRRMNLIHTYQDIYRD